MIITAYSEVDRAGSSSTKLESRFFRASIIIVLRENYTEAIKIELEPLFRRRDFFVTEISVLCSNLSLGARFKDPGRSYE